MWTGQENNVSSIYYAAQTVAENQFYAVPAERYDHTEPKLR